MFFWFLFPRLFQNHGYVKINVSPDAMSIVFVSSSTNTTLDSTELEKSDYSSDFYDDVFPLDLDDSPSDDYIYRDIL